MTLSRIEIAASYQRLAADFRSRAAEMHKAWQQTTCDTPSTRLLLSHGEMLEALATSLMNERDYLLGLTPAAAADTRDGMSIDDLKSTAGLLREKAKDVATEVLCLKDNIHATTKRLGQEDLTGVHPGEAMANTTLAFRALEEAQDRLNRLITALGSDSVRRDGGDDRRPA